MKNGNGTKNVKSFEKWHNEEVCRVFNVRRTENAPALVSWLGVTGATPQNWQTYIEELRRRLALHKMSWNEIELLSQFIAPLLLTVGFANEEKRIEIFSGRSLHFKYGNDEIKGEADWLVARGDFEPETPYFFLHEYKRFKRVKGDPLGQLLMAMLAAQSLNADGLPVYGAWVAGKNWQFVTLEGGVYSESKSYDASDVEELSKIWLILNKTKQIIYDRVDKLIQVENK